MTIPHTKHRNPDAKGYYFRCSLPDGVAGFVYLLSPQDQEDSLLKAIRHHQIPSFAVVLAAGVGEPDEHTVYNMERFFGFTREEHPSPLLCDLYTDE